MCFKVFHLLTPYDQQKHLSYVLSQYITLSSSHCTSAFTPDLCSWWTVVHLECPHHLSPPLWIQFISALLLTRTLVYREQRQLKLAWTVRGICDGINEKPMRISSSFRNEWVWELMKACLECVFWVAISKFLS